jgi:hypothetical protein
VFLVVIARFFVILLREITGGEVYKYMRMYLYTAIRAGSFSLGDLEFEFCGVFNPRRSRGLNDSDTVF